MWDDRLARLREAWSGVVLPEDYEQHMAAIGQAQANAELVRDLITRHPCEGERLLFAGAGTGQMIEFLDAEFLEQYELTFADLNPAFLAVLERRVERFGTLRYRVVVDDLESSTLSGTYSGIVVVLVLEHVEWRKAVATLARLGEDTLWIVIQANPTSMDTAVTPGRLLPGSMNAVRDVRPHLIPEGELVAALRCEGFELLARDARQVPDQKQMIGLVFRRLGNKPVAER